MSEFASVGVRRESPSVPRAVSSPPLASGGSTVLPRAGAAALPSAPSAGRALGGVVGGSGDGIGGRVLSPGAGGLPHPSSPQGGPGPAPSGRPVVPRVNPRAHTSFHLMAVVRHIGGGEGGHFVTYRRGPVPLSRGTCRMGGEEEEEDEGEEHKGEAGGDGRAPTGKWAWFVYLNVYVCLCVCVRGCARGARPGVDV
jgi:hypothetical protein